MTTENETPTGSDALVVVLSAHQAIRLMMENSTLSLMQLTAVFKIASTVCEETNAMNEKAVLTRKLRNIDFRR